jgi:hypothetical protein
MNSEKLKGHILILITNILFAVNMPISKYLLPAHVPPRRSYDHAHGFRLCDVLDRVSLHGKRESAVERLGDAFCMRPLRSGDQSGIVHRRAEPFFSSRRLHHRHRRADLRPAAGRRHTEGADHPEEVVRCVHGGQRRPAACFQFHARYRQYQQPRRRHDDDCQWVDVCHLPGSVEAALPALFIGHDDEMDVPLHNADAGSLHFPACARRSCIPPGGLGLHGTGCDLLRPLRGDVPSLSAHPDVVEENPPDNGQHVQLRAADRRLVHCRHDRPGHPFLAESPVGCLGLHRCLSRDTEQKPGRHGERETMTHLAHLTWGCRNIYTRDK